MAQALVLENRHTGERLSLRRIRHGNEEWLELKGTLPPHREGPPMHIHYAEDEVGEITEGALSAIVSGEPLTLHAGGSTFIPRGAAHRWWNEGDEPLAFEGVARPVVDLDRYLQGVFDIVNASPPDRPSLFYLAHLSLRHWNTQAILVIPRPVQAVLFRLLVAVGTVLGRYRGHDWPGSPARCPGAPPASA